MFLKSVHVYYVLSQEMNMQKKKNKKIKGTLQVLEKQLPLKIARKHRRKNIWLGVSPKDGQSGACRIQHNNFTTTTISKCPAMVQGLSPAWSIPHCCSQELHNNSPCSAGGEKHRVQQTRAGGVGRNSLGKAPAR